MSGIFKELNSHHHQPNKLILEQKISKKMHTLPEVYKRTPAGTPTTTALRFHLTSALPRRLRSQVLAKEVQAILTRC